MMADQPHFDEDEFFTSSKSGSQGSCVEVAIRADVVGVRDSKDRPGPMHVFAPARWATFIGGVKAGQFDLR